MNKGSLSYTERVADTLRRGVVIVVAVGSLIVSTFVVSSAHAAGCATGSQAFESVSAEQCYTVPSGVTAVTITAVGARGEAGSFVLKSTEGSERSSAHRCRPRLDRRCTWRWAAAMGSMEAALAVVRAVAVEARPMCAPARRRLPAVPGA
jgi:hypothetical protein